MTKVPETQTRQLGQSIEALLAEGADPMQSDLKGRTALHHAVEAGNLITIELLIRKGGKGLCWERDGSRRLALHDAAEAGSVAAVAAIVLKYGGVVRSMTRLRN